MAFYITAMVSFWLAALGSYHRPQPKKIVRYGLIAAFALISGLRFETGYDWIAYEDAFNEMPTIWRLFAGPLPFSAATMEPLFVLLLAIIKGIGGNFQSLFLVVALFNTFALIKFLKFSRTNIAVCMAIYFCWIYLPLQMGTMRQSIALSFLLLSVMAYETRKSVAAVAFFVVGLFFQYSLILFAPVFVPALMRMVLRYRYPFLAVLVMLYVFNSVFYGFVGSLSQYVGILLISEKLNQYSSGGPAPISLLAVVYLMINVLFFLYFCKQVNTNSRLDMVLIGSLILMLFFQTAFAQFPLLWSRIQYFAVLAQAALLCRGWVGMKLRLKRRYLTIALFASVIVFMKTILNPFIGPYFPYQSYVTHLIMDDPGTGRKRTEEFYGKFLELQR